MHERVGLPLLLTDGLLLEEFQRQSCLAQLLYHYVLITCMEKVVVLECIVVKEILSLIEVSHGLLVIMWVDDCRIVGIILMRITVDCKLTEALKPLRSHLIVREQTQCSSQHVSLPTILFSFRIPVITGRYRAVQLITAFSLQEFLDISLLIVGEFIPLEISRISYRHRPK